MKKYFLGIGTVLMIIILGSGAIWILDMVGLVQADQLILGAVSHVPGLADLPESYELGKKRGTVLQQKEAELSRRENRLTAATAKLQAAQATFSQEKSNLQNEKMQLTATNTAAAAIAPLAGSVSPVPSSGISTAGQAGKDNSIADKAVKKYLAVIGGMKPDKAAAVIQQLPDDVALVIFDQLRSSQAAKLMESLPPDYVTRITQARLKMKS